jgi:hypothetical protein
VQANYRCCEEFEIFHLKLLTIINLKKKGCGGEEIKLLLTLVK